MRSGRLDLLTDGPRCFGERCVEAPSLIRGVFGLLGSSVPVTYKLNTEPITVVSRSKNRNRTEKPKWSDFISLYYWWFGEGQCSILCRDPYMHV